MTTAGPGAPDPEQAPVIQRIDPYAEWRKAEGPPMAGGVYFRDMNEIETGPWPRKGDNVKGALCYLDGDDDCDEHIVELGPGASTVPERHIYTECFYVLSGRGSCSVWIDENAKQTFEWGAGSYFTLPTNAWYQMYNASLSQPAKYFSVTDLPGLMRKWINQEFVFANNFQFRDRYSGEADYFSAEAKLWKGRVWETNFIPDIYKLPLYEWKSRGGGGTNAFMIMGGGVTESHISRFQSGHYKKGHSHGPGAHLFITEGEGFSLLKRGNEPRIKADWKVGSLYLSGAGEGWWLHQHFNVGETPATYLVLGVNRSRKYAPDRWTASQSTVLRGGEVSAKEGGRQTEYEDEDPEIHRIFEDELKKRGVTCRMKNLIPWCTGEPGAESYKAHFEPDEHL